MLFAVTVPGGKLIPLNAAPVPDGNVAAYQSQPGRWLARVLRKGQEPEGWEKRYTPHFATCSDPAAHRKQQRDAVRNTQSEHNARLRSRRAADIQPGMFPLQGDTT